MDFIARINFAKAPNKAAIAKTNSGLFILLPIKKLSPYVRDSSYYQHACDGRQDKEMGLPVDNYLIY
ncbi:hypothetical protein VCR12J2_620112 [Vibrio coralliirubri]|nr:hypothetical protein VCR12J2_620112 [Vibrio coralliirubri]